MQNIRTKIKYWFESSELVSLVLIGSYSTLENHSESDIDFLAISSKPCGFESIVKLRSDFKMAIVDLFQPQKIGFRVRSYGELECFQKHSKSWGYDIKAGIVVLGKNVFMELPDFDDIRIDNHLLVDNLLERCWYDLLYLSISRKTPSISVKTAKSAWWLIKLLLFSHGKYPKSNTETIDFLSDECSALKSYSIDSVFISIIVKIITERVVPKGVSCQFIDKHRHTLLTQLSKILLWDRTNTDQKVKWQESYYWQYDSCIYRSIEEIQRNIDCYNMNYTTWNKQRIWRYILIENLIFIDERRFKKSQDYRQVIYKFYNLIFITDKVTKGNFLKMSENEMLVYIENKRLDTSAYKNDSSRKFEYKI